MSDPEERLETYRAKRDFAVTAEPAGSQAPAASGRFVVQRHRARRLHYDVRLEVDGVLASWAVPKGPTLDPAARQLAVHVEDHPIEYVDFEGVIPPGQYGGGDVIVWDRGTWQPSGTDDPAREIERGELHFDLVGEKLSGRFVLVRRDGDRSGKEQWLLLHKNDDHARPGWDPEEHPHSVKSGRTNDEVAAAPEELWRSGCAGPRGQADQPRQGPLSLPGRVGAGHQAGAGPLPRGYRPSMLPYLAGRPVNLHRYPDGVDRPGFWHKEVPGHAPEWLARWRNEEADPGETQCYAVVDSVAALAWMANYGAVELHPWTSRLPDVHQPTWALIDIDPGPRSSFDDVLVLARLYRTALDHLAVEAMPKVTGQRGVQIWVPIASAYTFDDTRGWVEWLSRAVGRTVPDLVSWEWHKDRREGLARLDYTQNAINKTLVAPFSARPAPGAPVSVPIRWEELDDPDLTSDRWDIRSVADRVAAVGDPLTPLVGRQQRLPPL